MKNLLVVIPALKKNAVIPDQLVKKLNGITLIQRAINTALSLTSNENILVVTDSEEISLICERNGVKYYKDTKLKFNSTNILDEIYEIIKDYNYENILLYRANTPLIDSEILKDAYKKFLENKKFILTSVKKEHKRLFNCNKNLLKELGFNEYFVELKAFYIFNKHFFKNKLFKPYIIDEEKSIEIESYQDWWVCEKILNRKRIVFNVIGDIKIGMGHVYHSLALAHEITDHEIIFVCDEKYKIAVDKIASTDYKVISTSNALDTILKLKPDLVINDILNTEEKYIKKLKENNIKVVNFEDLGEGSKYADLVFNDLYDEPQLKGDNYLWGYKYVILRDEFYEATPNEKIDEVKEILITFGGTDQNNLTLIILKSIINKCKEKNIKINILCGNGYRYKKELEDYINTINYSNIEIFYGVSMVSKIMEKSQIAISSNGRTVYELAHIHIPSIIISHHKREATHTFASLKRGFINLGVVDENTPLLIKEKFEKLIDDKDYRELLFLNIQKYDFKSNKTKVVNKILYLLKD
jgi:spore coat polysaccharide biosynthesis predicted glycosyltransferase SpsG/CMP-N-acetylneuraminic acid synthetase